MRISFVDAVERLPGSRLGGRLLPWAGRIDAMLHGRDDRAVSQRIALTAFVIRVFSAAIAYFSQVLLARWLGDFEYGVFAVVWVGAVILGGFSCLGFQIAIVRFVPEYFERNQSGLLRGVLLGSRIQGFLTATFFALAGAGGLYLFGDRIESYYLIPLYLGAVTLPMLAVGEIQDGITRAFSWSDLSLWPTYIVRPLVILATMALVIALGWKPDAVTAMGAVVVATYATTVGQLILLERRLKTVVPAAPREFRHMTWVAIALPMFVVEGFFNLLTNVDIIIVGFFAEPEQVAIYFAAVKTLALVHFVYFAVRAGGAQRFSKYYAAGDRVRLNAFVRDTLHWTFWPSLAMVALLLLIGRPLLSLFGPNFTSGYPLLFIISVGLLFRASIGPAESLLTMAGQQGICALIYTCTLMVNVGLNFTLIPIFGLPGAATATALALIIETIALATVTYTRLGIHCSILTTFFRRRPVAGEGPG